MQDALRVLALQVSNFQCLRFVRFEPDPAAPMVEVSGPNASGKSSVLDAIEAALGGGKHTSAEPLRRGEREASILLEVGPLRIERRWRRELRTDRVVADAVRVTDTRTGQGVRRPQAVLESLYSALTFEPLSFLALKPREQVEQLRQVVGLDFSDMDRDRAQLYDDRTFVNRQLRELEGELAGIVRHPGAAEVPLESIAERLEAALRAAAEADSARAAAHQLKASREARKAELAELEHQRRQLEGRIEKQTRELEALAESIAAAEQRAEQLAAQAPDPGPLRSELKQAHERNELARANARAAELEAKARELAARSRAMSEAMAQIDLRKEQLISGAAFPVEGLGFGIEGHVTFQGLPLEQASQAQRIRVAVGIGAALNPRLRVVLVREGSLLDARSIELLRAEMVQRDMQAWVEVVRLPGDDVGADGITLLDGEQVAA